MERARIGTAQEDGLPFAQLAALVPRCHEGDAVAIDRENDVVGAVGQVAAGSRDPRRSGPGIEQLRALKTTCGAGSKSTRSIT
jgi:hypothetical protein